MTKKGSGEEDLDFYIEIEDPETWFLVRSIDLAPDNLEHVWGIFSNENIDTVFRVQVGFGVRVFIPPVIFNRSIRTIRFVTPGVIAEREEEKISRER